MYVPRNRGKSHGIILRLEMLEDRRLLSGGLIHSLLTGPLPSLLVHLTPSEVSAILQEGQTSVGITAGGANASPGGITGNVVANANVGGILGPNLGVNVNLLQPGGNLIAFQASAGGTSGMGTLLSIGAQGSINPTQGITGGGQGGVGPFVNFSKDFGVGLGAIGGESFSGPEAMSLPGTLTGFGPGALAFPDLFSTGQNSPGSELAPSSLGTANGSESTPEAVAAIEESGPAGLDGDSLSPQAGDLQDASSSFGPIGLMFQRLLDQVEDFGHGLSNWLGQLGWVSLAVGLILTAAAGTAIRRQWRHGQGQQGSRTNSKETVEPWWFPGL